MSRDKNFQFDVVEKNVTLIRSPLLLAAGLTFKE